LVNEMYFFPSVELVCGVLGPNLGARYRPGEGAVSG